MKKCWIILLGLLGLVSCQHDPVQELAGSYAYKISGSATVEGTERVLTDETGTMELLKQSRDTLLVTFNALVGPAYTTWAKVDSNVIVLDAYKRPLRVGGKGYEITASGEGTVYDGTIVISLRYYGEDISASGLTLLCKKN